MIDALVTTILWTVAALGWVILLIRLIGLRSLSKITAFDFVITLASGSLLATAASSSEFLDRLGALVAIATLLLSQFALSWLRNRSSRLSQMMQNRPSLLFWQGRFLDEAMDDHRIARGDILAKLRSDNIKKLSDVQAVILETTGDLSVLSGGDVTDEVMNGVKFPASFGAHEEEASDEK